MNRAACTAVLVVACGGNNHAPPPAHDAAVAAWRPGQPVVIEPSRMSATMRYRLRVQEIGVNVTRDPAGTFRAGFCRGLRGTELTCADRSDSIEIALDDAVVGELAARIVGRPSLNDGWDHLEVDVALHADAVTASDRAALGETAAVRWYGAVVERLANLTRMYPPLPAVVWDAAPAITVDGDPVWFAAAQARDTTWSFVCGTDQLVAFPIDPLGNVEQPMRLAVDCASSERRLAAGHARVLVAVVAATTLNGDPFVPPSVGNHDLAIFSLEQRSWSVAARLPGQLSPRSAPLDAGGGPIYLAVADAEAFELLRVEHGAITNRWPIAGGPGDIALTLLDADHVAIAPDGVAAYQVVDVRKGAPRALVQLDDDDGRGGDRLVADGAGGAIVLQGPRTVVRVTGAGDQVWAAQLVQPADRVIVAGGRVAAVAELVTALLDLATGAVTAPLVHRPDGMTELADGTLALCAGSEVIALRDDREVARAPLGHACRAVFPRPDGGVVVATVAGEVVALAPTSKW